MIITNGFKLLATVIKNSILDISWVLNPSLYMELRNGKCTCSYKVDRCILEKINPWKQGINLTWIRRLEGVFRKSFDRLTNFQFTSGIQGSLCPVSSWNYYSYVIHYHDKNKLSNVVGDKT